MRSSRWVLFFTPMYSLVAFVEIANALERRVQKYHTSTKIKDRVGYRESSQPACDHDRLVRKDDIATEISTKQAENSWWKTLREAIELLIRSSDLHCKKKRKEN